MPTAPQKLLEQLAAVVGSRNVLTGKDALEFGTGWSQLGQPLVLVRPADTQEVAACVKACCDTDIAVVPWGGRTGLVSGTCADDAVAISLDRMNQVVSLDPIDAIMQVQAGCVVQAAAEAAEAQGLFFPLDLGARGSATIGGTIATNAGGNRVVRFGMMRDIVLGLEVVLADGTIVSSLYPLIKNNTGYDLKHLFIGAEGTLGIVTQAILRLRPELPSRNAALVATGDFEAAARLLRNMETRLGGQLSAFEAMWPEYYELVTTAPAHGRPILPHGSPMYILIETMGGDQEQDRAAFEAALVAAMEDELVTDAVIARSEADVAAMWALRDDGEQVARIGPFVALDVSLRLSRIPAYITELRQRLEEQRPGTALVLFGHVGDGNIHVIIGAGSDPAQRGKMTRQALELAGKYGGSISAEHGIGMDKRDYLHLSRSPEELRTMLLVKQALDPRNLMNPGKILLPPQTGTGAMTPENSCYPEARTGRDK